MLDEDEDGLMAAAEQLAPPDVRHWFAERPHMLVDA